MNIRSKSSGQSKSKSKSVIERQAKLAPAQVLEIAKALPKVLGGESVEVELDGGDLITFSATSSGYIRKEVTPKSRPRGQLHGIGAAAIAVAREKGLLPKGEKGKATVATPAAPANADLLAAFTAFMAAQAPAPAAAPAKGKRVRKAK